MKRILLTVTLATIAVAIPMGCGGGDDESAARPLEERVAESADAPLPADGTLPTNGDYVGEWSASFTIKELGAAAADTRLAGEHRLELRDDGTYTASQDGHESVGAYGAAAGDHLVFTKDTGCDQNRQPSEPVSTSVYAWKVDGDALTLTIARRETGAWCTGRADMLAVPRWERS